MSFTIIQEDESQNIFDPRTDRKRSVNSPGIQLVKEVLKRHRFPGHTSIQSNQWVTDTALDLMDRYDPNFVFLVYAQQYHLFGAECPGKAKRELLIDEVFEEVERFKRKSGFLTIVVGTGDMIPVYDNIDLKKLDGLAVTSQQLSRYAGIYGLSQADMHYLRALSGIEKLVSKEEFLALFYDGLVAVDRLPDYLTVAREGYCFGATMPCKTAMIPSHNYSIPVSAGKGKINLITDISDNIAAALQNNKVALILLDGVGIRDFRIPYAVCSNSKGWYTYETGEAQYLTISTGKHQAFVYPLGCRSYMEDDKNNRYTVPGALTTVAAQTLGRRLQGRSIAVGNRNMPLHIVTGTDITIECVDGNLSNQGCRGVVRRYRQA
ncbi:hypothetical protein [Sporomusa aerivorans]|uniref:hypothetical protein n=1 Tax=Sporomusa aerivorans TaxID=204936 RepID=UPI00352B1B45